METTFLQDRAASPPRNDPHPERAPTVLPARSQQLPLAWQLALLALLALAMAYGGNP